MQGGLVTGGYGGGSCAVKYADIDWTKEKKSITFNVSSNDINFKIDSSAITFSANKSNDIVFSINNSNNIVFNIETHDIKFNTKMCI